ncbi:hypothetical protein [Streptomyces caatingaensis]|uniref:Uncharacterized protein n=1 Tax=Streptomyces caatingaensis TaxID=1678637 RepID=A0A0K9XLD6_9ACTN|nr:hypothetical protein [Streptomyces caatingaensis]KNB53482.1 hypothetical protein AC230_02090 [Streptomyces caatingaensis]
MPHHPMPAPNAGLEAAAWIDVLLRYGLVHAAVEGPDGQWLAQIRPDSTVWLLRDASEVLTLAATFQQQLRGTDGENR